MQSIPNPIVNNPGTVSPVFGKTKKSASLLLYCHFLGNLIVLFRHFHLIVFLKHKTFLWSPIQKMTVGELMKAYEGCITNLRKSQSQRRINSLKRISPVNYTKEVCNDMYFRHYLALS